MHDQATRAAGGMAAVALMAAGGMVGLADPGDWQPFELFALLLALALLSDAFPVEARGMRISGSFLAIVLAMALLGPVPAAVIGVATVLSDAVLARPAGWRLLLNVVTYAAFPLGGGLAFELLGYDTVPSGASVAFAMVVLTVFVTANLANFLMIAWPICVRESVSLRGQIRRLYIPVLPVEFATGVLTAAVAYGYQRIGIVAVGLLAVVGLVFQYLLRLAFKAAEQSEQLEVRSQQLAALQVGLLTTVMNTLAMRDRMTARHSAAVARYARAMARAVGCDEREVEVIHTAGLLHDIGKFIFPDSILVADRRLTDEEFEIVKQHPEQGAALLRRIDGYGNVAEIVVAHHERMDGRGYPSGLSGDAIPLGARMLSVADVYDVITARDSYRKPIPRDEAIAELRRSAVAGQLDPHLVEVFIDLLEREVVDFRHADNADFEAELDFNRRVREYAAPRERIAA